MKRMSQYDGVLIKKKNLREFLEEFNDVRLAIYDFSNAQFYIEFRSSYPVREDGDILDGTGYSRQAPIFRNKMTATAKRVIDDLNLEIQDDCLYLVDRPKELLMKRSMKKVFPFKGVRLANYASYNDFMLDYGKESEQFLTPVEHIWDVKFEKFMQHIDDEHLEH
jgi:hypothetical protein